MQQNEDLRTPLLSHDERGCGARVGEADATTRLSPAASRHAAAATRALGRRGSRHGRRTSASRKSSESSCSTTARSSVVSLGTKRNPRQSFFSQNAGRGDENLDSIPRERMTPGQTARFLAVMAGTVTSIGAYAGAFVIDALVPILSTPGLVSAGVAGGVALLTAASVLVKERKLSKLPTLRRRTNELRKEAERLESGVTFLAEERSELELEVKVLQVKNKSLENIVRDQGGNIEELVKLVQENQRILHEMKKSLREVVIQDVVRMVLQSGIDLTGVIGEQEAMILATRLKITLDAYEIVFDTEKCLRAIGLAPSAASVLGIVKRLLPEDEEAERQDLAPSIPSVRSLYQSDSEITDYSEGAYDPFDMFYLRVN